MMGSGARGGVGDAALRDLFALSTLGSAGVAACLGIPLLGTYFVYFTLLFVYASAFPQQTFFLFGMIPVRVRVLALFSLAVLLYGVFSGGRANSPRSAERWSRTLLPLAARAREVRRAPPRRRRRTRRRARIDSTAMHNAARTPASKQAFAGAATRSRAPDRASANARGRRCEHLSARGLQAGNRTATASAAKASPNAPRAISAQIAASGGDECHVDRRQPRRTRKSSEGAVGTAAIGRPPCSSRKGCSRAPARDGRGRATRSVAGHSPLGSPPPPPPSPPAPPPRRLRRKRRRLRRAFGAVLAPPRRRGGAWLARGGRGSRGGWGGRAWPAAGCAWDVTRVRRRRVRGGGVCAVPVAALPAVAAAAPGPGSRGARWSRRLVAAVCCGGLQSALSLLLLTDRGRERAGSLLWLSAAVARRAAGAADARRARGRSSPRRALLAARASCPCAARTRDLAVHVAAGLLLLAFARDCHGRSTGSASTPRDTSSCRMCRERFSAAASRIGAHCTLRAWMTTAAADVARAASTSPRETRRTRAGTTGGPSSSCARRSTAEELRELGVERGHDRARLRGARMTRG